MPVPQPQRRVLLRPPPTGSSMLVPAEQPGRLRAPPPQPFMPYEANAQWAQQQNHAYASPQSSASTQSSDGGASWARVMQPRTPGSSFESKPAPQRKPTPIKVLFPLPGEQVRPQRPKPPVSDAAVHRPSPANGMTPAQVLQQLRVPGDDRSWLDSVLSHADREEAHAFNKNDPSWHSFSCFPSRTRRELAAEQQRGVRNAAAARPSRHHILLRSIGGRLFYHNNPVPTKAPDIEL